METAQANEIAQITSRVWDVGPAYAPKNVSPHAARGSMDHRNAFMLETAIMMPRTVLGPRAARVTCGERCARPACLNFPGPG